MAKTTFKLGDIEISINGNPVTIKGFEITNEATAQELATSGGFINQLVETIGNIAERFDNGNHTPEPVKEIEVKKPQPVTDFCEIKEKTEKPELPTAIFRGGEPIKKPFNLTKAWRAIPVPEQMKKADPDKYRWLGKQYPIADSVSVDGGTFGVVYIHIEAMNKKCFIIIRPENVKFEDDIRPEDFADYMDAINIPGDIKEYIQKVIEL